MRRCSEVKVIIVGLDNAGKTTTLYKYASTLLGRASGIFFSSHGPRACRRLLLNEVVVTAPTIGSNVEEVQFKNLKFVMWDLGGQESSRAAWATYYKQTNAIVMVIDSTDRERIGLVKGELDRMMQADSLKTAGASRVTRRRRCAHWRIADGAQCCSCLPTSRTSRVP